MRLFNKETFVQLVQEGRKKAYQTTGSVSFQPVIHPVTYVLGLGIATALGPSLSQPIRRLLDRETAQPGGAVRVW